MSYLDDLLVPTQFIGVDVGIHGAIALLGTDGKLVVLDMPITSVKVGKKGKRNQIDASALSRIIGEVAKNVALVCFEKLHAVPRDGKVGAFSFGRSYGVVQGIMAAHKLCVLEIAPEKWKATFKLTADKDDVRAKATKAFPDNAHLWEKAAHHDRAEAAYLALYGLIVAQKTKKV